MSPLRDTRPRDSEPLGAYHRVSLRLPDGRGELTAMVMELRYSVPFYQGVRSFSAWELHLEACHVPDSERDDLVDLGLLLPGSIRQLPLPDPDRDQMMEWVSVEAHLTWEPDYGDILADPDRITGSRRAGFVIASCRRRMHLDKQPATHTAPRWGPSWVPLHPDQPPPEV